jgi:hypothetical protein
MTEDFEAFASAVRDIAEGNAAAILRGEDPLNELEANALRAAANAYCLFVEVREMRQALERQQAEAIHAQALANGAAN